MSPKKVKGYLLSPLERDPPTLHLNFRYPNHATGVWGYGVFWEGELGTTESAANAYRSRLPEASAFSTPNLEKHQGLGFTGLGFRVQGLGV